MKTIQITLRPDDWTASRLTATGVMKEGKLLSPSVTTMTIGELPAEHASVMGGILSRFLSIDPGGKAATFAEAFPACETGIDAEGNLTETRLISLTIHWLYPDQTTEQEVFRLDQGGAVNLIDYLLSADSYQQ